jgi:hypothetical protein
LPIQIKVCTIIGRVIGTKGAVITQIPIDVRTNQGVRRVVILWITNPIVICIRLRCVETEPGDPIATIRCTGVAIVTENILLALAATFRQTGIACAGISIVASRVLWVMHTTASLTGVCSAGDSIIAVH